MSTMERGIWSDAAGGFIATQLYTDSEIREDLERFIRDGEESEDLKVLEICPEHEEQIAATCEECFAEDGEEDEDEDL